jgi:hypothetical protein
VDNASSAPIFVDAFHFGLPRRVSVAPGVDLPGVKLCVCLWPGRSGVEGSSLLPRKRREVLARRVRTGSEDGSRLILDTEGVIGRDVGCLGEPLSLCASFRNGDLVFSAPFVDFPLFDPEVAAERADPLSLGVCSSPWSIRRISSMSSSVRCIRSRRFLHRCVDSACRRKHSPFLVTRS